MTKSKKEMIIPDEIVVDKIYLIRWLKVMLDSDLAELYGIETKSLKRAVKRNATRLPAKQPPQQQTNKHNNRRRKPGIKQEQQRPQDHTDI